ncbi:MAG: hypothetical protein WD749_05825 [Phycisphaerales bacterium]
MPKAITSEGISIFAGSTSAWRRAEPMAAAMRKGPKVRVKRSRPPRPRVRRPATARRPTQTQLTSGMRPMPLRSQPVPRAMRRRATMMRLRGGAMVESCVWRGAAGGYRKRWDAEAGAGGAGFR